MPLLLFVLLAIFFGLALFAATDAIIVLAGQPEPTRLWWFALIPLAVTHWVSGFLATWRSSTSTAKVCAAISAAATILAIMVAACAAYAVGFWMPRYVAVPVLVAASLAGLIGLALAAWLRLGLPSRPWTSRSR